MPGIGIGRSLVRLSANIRSDNGLSPALEDKFLFLWTGRFDRDGNLLSDIDSTYITVNNKDFSTSYITATSAATFTSPSGWVTADTDTLWRYNGSGRNVTVSELIGYDFGRTFVAYANEAPHHITKIGVLKAGETLTATEIDQVHAYFSLSQFWSGVQNDYGYLKANRAGYLPFLESESTALLARFTTPAADARRRAIDNLIKYYKDYGIWDKLDVFVNLRAADLQAALLNWKGNFCNASLINSPTFTANTGVTIATTGSKYGKTGYAPNTHKINWSQNGASMGFKFSGFDNTPISFLAAMGSNGGSPGYNSMITQYNGGSRSTLNDTGFFTGMQILENGYNTIVRTSSTQAYQYKNGTKISGTSPSDGISTLEMYFGCSNENGTPKYFCNSVFEMYFMGGLLTDADELVIRTGYNAYIAAL